MITRKKRNTIIIVSIVILVVILITTFILLYSNTDMFKSNATLFAKYFGQSVQNIDNLYQEIGQSQYNEWLKQNKCTTETQVKVKVIENKGTTAENSQNSINQWKLKIDGQIDTSNQYNEQKIQLVNQDKKVAQIEAIQKGNTYGIRFSDLFNQYLLVKNEKLNELLRKAGYRQEAEKMPEHIEVENKLKSIFGFSEEEIQKWQTTYSQIIQANVSTENFSKQKNQTLQINGNTIQANAYILTLTKEEMNHLSIKILEQLKQDEILLNKLDNLQNLFNQYPIDQITKDINVKKQFVENIENLINQIVRNNIGQETAQIIVYENNGRTVKTTIQNPDYEINSERFSLPTENYVQVSYRDTKKEQILVYKNVNNEEKSLDFTHIEDEKTTEYSYLIEEKIKGNKGIKNTILTYENNNSQVEAMIEQEINKVEQLKEQEIFNKEKAINLSELEEEQLKNLLNRVNNKVSEKITEIITNDINQDDLGKVLKIMGIIKEGQNFEETGITQTEKDRFNSQFEILQGEQLEGKEILNVIKAIQDNLLDIEAISKSELKLKLDRYHKNEEITNKVIEFIEKNKKRKYNVKVEYDENTGLVIGILLTMLEK